jgi:quercetin dioxygenase-like cupin family protein
MELQSHDPIVTDGNLYHVVFENERVRVLEYRDRPGERTHRHRHPDSVMYVLSDFRRRVSQAGQEREVELSTGQVRWVAAQEHVGENIGDTESHAIFVELKDSGPLSGELGPREH